MRYYSLDTDRGSVRERNEDSIAVVERSNFLCLIVCDGMGGHAAGALASQIAVEELQKYFSFDDPIEEGQEQSLLEEALQKANDRINYVAMNKDHNGMGSTVVVALLVEDGEQQRLTVAYAGDSRAYIFTVAPSGESNILPLTKDHNVYNDATDPELVPVEEREYLTQALGVGSTVQPRVNRSFNFPKDAVLLLCSDGLYEMLSSKEMLRILAGKNVEQASSALIQEANDRGSRDNVSVVLFKHGKESMLLPELSWPPDDLKEISKAPPKKKTERRENPSRGGNVKTEKRNPPRNSPRSHQNRQSQQVRRNDAANPHLEKPSRPQKTIEAPETQIWDAYSKDEKLIWGILICLIGCPLLVYLLRGDTEVSVQNESEMFESQDPKVNKASNNISSPSFQDKTSSKENIPKEEGAEKKPLKVEKKVEEIIDSGLDTPEVEEAEILEPEKAKEKTEPNIEEPKAAVEAPIKPTKELKKEEPTPVVE